jgi:hypothetical protein
MKIPIAILAAAAALLHLVAPSPNASAAIDGTTLADTIDLSPGADAFQPTMTGLKTRVWEAVLLS